MMVHNYAPENVSGPVLMTEFATDLIKLGHQVTVITAAPNYPYGRVFLGYRNSPYQVEWIDGVRVVRTWSYISPLKTFWRRIFNYGTFSITSFFGALRAGRPEILIVVTPPLPLGMPAWALSRLWRVPLLVQIEDIYPEAAVAMGVLRNRAAISFFSAVERFLYRKATHISVISEGFRRNLLGKHVPASKISVIPVWADTDLVRPLPKENAFRERNGLQGKFVVMYAGNIGLTSRSEDILASAEILQAEPNIKFVIVGEGVKKAELEALSNSKQLSNVVFLPYQPREGFAEMMAAADVNLVTLNNNSSRTSMPSKTFNIMASARPILAVTPPDSEVAALVEESKCGINVPPEQPIALTEAILDMMRQPQRLIEWGQNGRSQLEGRYSRKHCINEHERMLSSIWHNADRIAKS
jgi:colanic acid biosynthesis glycosyl transferase WcaI